MHESAKFVGPAVGSGVRIGPSVAVSGANAFVSDGNTVNVFSQPHGGWSGTVHETAILASPNGQGIESIAVSQSTLVASTSQTLEVFTMPSGGWSGQPQPSAILSPVPNLYGGLSGSVAISDHLIAAAGAAVGNGSREAVYVFSRRRGGWSALSRQSATLTLPYDGGMLGPSVAASDEAVAFTTAFPGSTEHECPCGGELYAVTPPLDGWSGTSTASLLAQFSPVYGGPNLALNNNTIALGANGVHVLLAASSQAIITKPELTRLQTSTPRLRFTVVAAPAAAPTKAITVRLPPGIRLTGHESILSHGISGSGTPIRVPLARANRLVITIDKPSRRVTLTINAGALTKSPGFTNRIDLLASVKYRHGHSFGLAFAIHVRDAAGHVSRAGIDATIR